MVSKFRAGGSERHLVGMRVLYAALAMLVAVGISAPGIAQGATITVNTLSDTNTAGDGHCSLREAVNNANTESDASGGDCVAGTGDDTIVFASGLSGTIPLGSPLFLGDSALTNVIQLTIDGGGRVAIAASGAPLYDYVFWVYPATVKLDNLTIEDGSGIACISNFGNLTVSNSILENNTDIYDSSNPNYPLIDEGDGGAIYNDSGATLTVGNSTFYGNSVGGSAGGSGGAILNNGTLVVTDSSFEANIGDAGAAIANRGTATISGSTFYGNSGGNGGAILDFNNGHVSVTDCSFSGNSAGKDGGAIYESQYSGNATEVSVTDSSFSGNTANGSSSHGGAITDFGGTLNATGSSFVGNSATVAGGGIDTYAGGVVYSSGNTFSANASASGGGVANHGTLNVVNSTLSGNTADTNGGGIDNTGTLTVGNSTIFGNSAASGGGIDNDGGTATVKGTILASDSSGNCHGTISDGAYNISDDGTCGFASYTLPGTGATIGDNVEPMLSGAGLADNGGPTQTIALQSASPAIDVIPLADCPPTDQRGVDRGDTGEGYCDVGAYESHDTIVPFASFDAKLTMVPSKGEFSLSSNFTLGSGGSIDLSTQSVTLQLGDSGGYSVTVAPGSFVAKGKNAYVFEASVNNVPIEMKLALQSDGSYGFKAKASGADLSGITNPVTVTLTIRSEEFGNSGSVSTTATVR